MLRWAGLCRLLPAVVRRLIPGKFHDVRVTEFACRLVHAGSRQPWRFGHDAGIGLTGIREHRGPKPRRRAEAASALCDTESEPTRGWIAKCYVAENRPECLPYKVPSWQRNITAGATYSKQQTRETRQPIPARAGQPAREDFEYERNGVANLFMLFASLLGFRLVEITDRRTRTDWARLIRKLVDEIFPGKTLVLVMDNLNIHSLASLCEAFPPAEARRIAERLEIHFTPKHGSWLNLAEIELSVLGRQCLDRRIPDREALLAEVGAWQDGRNRAGAGANWRFKTADA